jgi:hypothetical protein
LRNALAQRVSQPGNVVPREDQHQACLVLT